MASFIPQLGATKKPKEFLSLVQKRKAEAGSWLAAELLLCLGVFFYLIAPRVSSCLHISSWGWAVPWEGGRLLGQGEVVASWGRRRQHLGALGWGWVPGGGCQNKALLGDVALVSRRCWVHSAGP